MGTQEDSGRTQEDSGSQQEALPQICGGSERRKGIWGHSLVSKCSPPPTHTHEDTSTSIRFLGSH